MGISVPFSPAKAFAFVRIVKTYAAENTVIRPRQGAGATGTSARAEDISPQDIGIATRNKASHASTQFTPHDRLIDLYI